MNPDTNIAKTIARAERVIAGLRSISELPAAKAWDLAGTDLLTCIVQFFPVAMDRDCGFADEAKAFARALGGTWEREIGGRKWESTNVNIPGMDDVKVVLHYVEPRTKAPTQTVDLGADEEPQRDRDEPDYDAPKPLTPMENTLRNDEHFVP